MSIKCLGQSRRWKLPLCNIRKLHISSWAGHIRAKILYRTASSGYIRVCADQQYYFTLLIYHIKLPKLQPLQSTKNSLQIINGSYVTEKGTTKAPEKQWFDYGLVRPWKDACGENERKCIRKVNGALVLNATVYNCHLSCSRETNVNSAKWTVFRPRLPSDSSSSIELSMNTKIKPKLEQQNVLFWPPLVLYVLH